MVLITDLLVVVVATPGACFARPRRTTVDVLPSLVSLRATLDFLGRPGPARAVDGADVGGTGGGGARDAATPRLPAPRAAAAVAAVVAVDDEPALELVVDEVVALRVGCCLAAAVPRVDRPVAAGVGATGVLWLL